MWVVLDGGADRPASQHALPSPTNDRSNRRRRREEETEMMRKVRELRISGMRK